MARILLAEDDDTAREAFALALAAAGHEVTAAADGIEAMRHFVGDAFDVLLTDIVMPAMDGIELAKQARRRFPDLKVVLMSGYEGVAEDAEPMVADAARIVVKPLAIATLIAEIEALLAA